MEPPGAEIIISARAIESLQNLSYIGELKQVWEEIKKLQVNHIFETGDYTMCVVKKR